MSTKKNPTVAKSKVKTPNVNNHNKRMLDDIVDALVKVTGPGVTQLLGSDGLAIKIRGVVSTQCAGVDGAIGRGGIPLGRITVLHGMEASGKTTLALHIAAEFQQQGGIVLFVDAEYKLDPEYASNIGVDVSKLIICQPEYLEKVYSVIDKTIEMVSKVESKRKIPVLVVLDSLNAARAKCEIEGDWDAAHYAPQARIHSNSIPKILKKLSDTDVALLFISQVRENVGVIFGPKDTIAGGKSVKFYASVIMGIKTTGKIKNGKDEPIGNHTELEVRKNGIAPPFKKARFDILYGIGIDRDRSVINRAVELGIVLLKGAYYSYGDVNLGQGMRNVLSNISEDVLEAIKREVMLHDRKSRKN